MSWRERYQRYRRYGLDPLPADADDAQREARIAELRSLRDTLRQLADSCQGDQRADCPILRGLEQGAGCAS